MFDTSKQFEKFIKDHVVLQGEKQQELRDKKNKNIDRLRNGLVEYNKDNKTQYGIAETRVQGSMAMNTVIQNDAKDYDIDVAIVFDRSNIGETMGSLQARRLVKAALDYKMGQFSEEAEVKTNCVRIKYAEGYHVDFAVYRRFKEADSNEYTYEHAGSAWTKRDPKAITAWFQDEVKVKGTSLRKVVRLSKMFCKSRDSWVNMPGGLIQSVLCVEKYDIGHSRIDEIFYNTMTAIKDRLELDNEIYNPTDSSMSLLTAQNHYDKVNNWKNRLDDKLKVLDVLFDTDCTFSQACDAWHDFFQHDFWSDLADTTNKSFALVESSRANSVIRYADSEQFIEDQVSAINDIYSVYVKVTVEATGFRQQLLREFFSKHRWFRDHIPHGMNIDFYATTNAPKPYEIWWKVRNVGEYAEKHNKVRGQIIKGDGCHRREYSQFEGPHFVECYVIKNGECVAMTRVPVDIGESSI